jgi:hypothetical protein
MEQILFFMLGILLVSVSVLTVVVVRSVSRLKQIEFDIIKQQFNDNQVISDIYSTLGDRYEQNNRRMDEMMRDIHDEISNIKGEIMNLDRTVDSRIDKLLNKLK